jgi:hypothetical protein
MWPNNISTILQKEENKIKAPLLKVNEHLIHLLPAPTNYF